MTKRLWDALTSLKLAILCLSLLMVLVVACTLAQVDMGTSGAVDRYMRAFVVWWDLPEAGFKVPILPGGATVGMVLAVNLFAAQIRRLQFSWRKAGLWIAHAGLILLVAGEFVTAVAQIDGQMAIEEGQTTNYVERPKEDELVLVDTTDPKYDDVYGVPASLLASAVPIAVPGTPISLRMHGYAKNAAIRRRTASDLKSPATAGIGPTLTVQTQPEVTADDQRNESAVFAEPFAGSTSYGVWLLSAALGAPQDFVHAGRTYSLLMRPRREYLPYSVTLKKFRHDVYAGTDIPKNFSSLVHLESPGSGESRDVLIYMNQPLRFAGKTFYQASFGKNDTLTVLQVVQNPGWLLPYIACALVTLGLLIHFAIELWRRQRKLLVAAEAA